MTKIGLGSLIALAIAIVGGVAAFSNLQGRVAAIESTLSSPVETMKAEGKKIHKELRETMENLQKSAVPSGTIAAFIQKSCPQNWSEMDGVNELPDLRGRFLVGAGPFPQDQERELRLGQAGGSHQMRIKAYGNQAECCSDDQSIIQIHIEWKEEGEIAVQGRGDGHKEQTRSRWMNHFPPYVAVRWCTKD